MPKKTNADYKREQHARAKALAEKLGIVNRTLPLPKSINVMLDELCERHEFTDWRELVITMIRVAHAGVTELVEIPPSGFVPTEQQLHKVGKAPVCEACKELGYLCVECEEVEK